MKKVLLVSLISLGLISSSVFAMEKTKTIKRKWDGNVHEKIVKVKKCWPRRGYCKIKKRIIFLNRDWPDRVIIRERDW